MTLKEIQKYLRQHATEAAKKSTLKFIPDAVKVYGNTMPLINDLAATIAKQITDVASGFKMIEQLWHAGAYEEKILAAKLTRKICKQEPLLSI
ncbi:MAG: DNA alkylation repair protein, partial [Fimbriimonadaceae bacterium]|nr:DNA alkylation repair protein [Chitinophagales bacterium]